MKPFNPINADNVGDILLYGAIMLASIDYAGILDYAIKAAIGGAIWFTFKIAGDHFSRKLKKGTGTNAINASPVSDDEQDEGGPS